MEGRPSKDWWKTFEANILGVYNTIRPAIKHLRKTEGTFIAVTSVGAQFRSPNASDYQVRYSSLSWTRAVLMICNRCRSTRSTGLSSS